MLLPGVCTIRSSLEHWWVWEKVEGLRRVRFVLDSLMRSKWVERVGRPECWQPGALGLLPSLPAATVPLPSGSCLGALSMQQEHIDQNQGALWGRVELRRGSVCVRGALPHTLPSYLSPQSLFIPQPISPKPCSYLAGFCPLC